MFHRVSTDDDIIEVVKLARSIWIEHYSPKLQYRKLC